MRTLVITAALVIVSATPSPASQEPVPRDLEKARRLLGVEMGAIRRALVDYRNEHVVGRTGPEREANGRTWWGARRRHVQIAADMRDSELDLDGAARLLAHAKELASELRALRGVKKKGLDLVVAAAVAPNDACTSAQPVGEGTFLADTTMATHDGHSSCDFNVASDVWYTYTASASGEIVFQTAGSDYDTILSLHPACPGIDNHLACNDDDHPLTTSRIIHDMAAGETVLVRVAGDNGSSGSLVLDIAFAGSLEGTVVASGSGDPIASRRVWLWTDGDVEGTTSTNPSGQYHFDGIPAGSYTVQVRTDVPYLGELYDDIDCVDFNCDPTTGTAVVVTAGATTSGIDFALDTGGSVQGTVTAQLGGAPVENVRVEVFDTAGRWIADGRTDASGDYVTDSALSAGVYTAATTGLDRFFGELYDELPCPNSCDETLGTPIVINEGVQTGGVDFTLLESGAIGGTVRDAVNGFPLDAQVRIYDTVGSSVESVFASNAGAYVTDDPLPAGQYTAVVNVFGYLDEIYSGIHCSDSCDPTTGIPIMVADGVVTPNVDFHIVRGAGVLGVVTDAQTSMALEHAHVTLLSSDGGFVDSRFSDETGSFFLNDEIEPGAYYAMASASGYFDEAYDDVPCESPSCTVSVGTSITVGLSELRSGIDFALSKPTATCAPRQALVLAGNVFYGIYEAYSSIDAVDATFWGFPAFPITLRSRDVVSFGNGTSVLSNTSLVVELDPFVGCPATP